MAERSVQGVIFDMDGTLADTLDHYYGMACDFVEFAGAPPVSREYVYALMGSGDPDLMQKLFPPDFPDLEQKLRRIVRERLGIWTRRVAEETAPLEGCANLLQELHGAGYLLGIATSSGRDLPYLDSWGVRELFAAVVGREDVAQRKPHPEAILQCLSALELEPSATLYVGDSPIDIEAGRAAGVVTVGVLTGTTTREGLAAAEPDHILETAADLPSLL